MQKAALALLTFIYLLVSSGIMLEVHYCMGKTAGVEWYSSSKSERCSVCGMKEKKGGCCSNTQQFYKLSNYHKQAINYLSFEAPVSDLALPQWAAYVAPPIAYTSIAVPHSHSPPPLPGQKRHVLLCVFRI
jgi:hypothetical protein